MTGRPRRAGLIVNPRSGKGSGKGQALAEMKVGMLAEMLGGRAYVESLCEFPDC